MLRAEEGPYSGGLRPTFTGLPAFTHCAPGGPSASIRGHGPPAPPPVRAPMLIARQEIPVPQTPYRDWPGKLSGGSATGNFLFFKFIHAAVDSSLEEAGALLIRF